MKKAALSELCAIAGGIPAPKETSLSGDIPFVRMRELGNAHLSTNFVPSDEFLTKHDEKVFAAKIIQRGATLFPRSGSVHLNHRALLQTPAAIVSHIAALIPNEETDPEFLYHLLTSYDMTEIMTQTTGLNMIKFGQLKDVRFTVPDTKPEQSKIAEILTLVGRAIEQTEALIAKQQRIKTGLMQDLLTKGIDAHGNIRSEATHAFKDSPLGRIPVEWTPSSLGKVYSELPRNGIYKPAAQIGAGVILVGQTSFTEERLIDYTQTRRVQVSDSETRAYGLRAGDILVSRVFATIEGVGLPTFVHEVPEIAVYESNMLRFRINRELAYPLFINYWLLSESVRRTIVSSVNASNQVSINQQALADLPLPLPPLEEQELILACLEDARATQKANKSSLVKALAVKVGLANDLLTGKRRVTPLLAAETSQPDV